MLRGLVRRLSPDRSDKDDILDHVIEDTEVTDAQFPEWQIAEGRQLDSGQQLAVPCAPGGLVPQLLFDSLGNSPTIKDPDALELFEGGRVEFDVEAHVADSVPSRPAEHQS
jgi:hypothetical protein